MARFPVKHHGRHNKSPKPIILIVAEGRNVTETLYFKQFQKQHSDYNIKLLMPGSSTDPKGMLNKLETFWRENEMSLEAGDYGFVVLDLDCNDKKGELIEKLDKSSRLAKFIVSNPCFEVWYLLHFKYTTHIYTDGNDVISDLRNYIPGYEKNIDVNENLSDKTDTAITNAYRIKKHFEDLGYKWPSKDCNPRTDIHEVITTIRNIESNQSNQSGKPVSE